MKEKDAKKKEIGPEMESPVGSKAKKYFLYAEIMKTMLQQQAERRRSRRFPINRELVEVNGRPGGGARVIDLSANGARLYLPFTRPFMSQITFTFALKDQSQVLRLTARVIWSRPAPAKGWYYVGVQFYQNLWEIEQLLRLEENNPSR